MIQFGSLVKTAFYNWLKNNKRTFCYLNSPFPDQTFLWASGADPQELVHQKLAILHSVQFYNPGKGELRFWHIAESIGSPGLYVNVTQNGVSKRIHRVQKLEGHWTQRIVQISQVGMMSITIAAAPVGHGIDEIEYTRDGRWRCGP